MDGFEVQLFLGFPVNANMEIQLKNINPHQRALFINNESNYLHSVTEQGIKHLGKYLGSILELSDIELIEANILSLLKKLLPKFTDTLPSLILLPVERK